MTLIVGIPYIVTAPAFDETLEVGDLVELAADGRLVSREHGGWFDREDVADAIRGAEFAVDRDAVERKRQRLLAELERLPK
jgi:hypothetical protein